MADENQAMGGVHFPFPFPPYPIQKDFMEELYKVLEAGKIGIFESPTGTVGVRDEGVSLRQRGGRLIYLWHFCADIAFLEKKLGTGVVSLS